MFNYSEIGSHFCLLDHLGFFYCFFLVTFDAFLNALGNFRFPFNIGVKLSDEISRCLEPFKNFLQLLRRQLSRIFGNILQLFMFKAQGTTGFLFIGRALAFHGLVMPTVETAIVFLPNRIFYCMSTSQFSQRSWQKKNFQNPSTNTGITVVWSFIH